MVFLIVSVLKPSFVLLSRRGGGLSVSEGVFSHYFLKVQKLQEASRIIQRLSVSFYEESTSQDRKVSYDVKVLFPWVFCRFAARGYSLIIKTIFKNTRSFRSMKSGAGPSFWAPMFVLWFVANCKCYQPHLCICLYGFAMVNKERELFWFYMARKTLFYTKKAAGQRSEKNPVFYLVWG